MDELAELGVAAHWRYKEGKGYSAKAEQKEIEKNFNGYENLFLCQMISKMAMPKNIMTPFLVIFLKPMFMFNATREKLLNFLTVQHQLILLIVFIQK